jgi:flagellar motility protein MotE (MotC chaperone)
VEFPDFLGNLKHVATSPYAFAAYIAVIAAWVYSTVARHRLDKIADLLQHLPSEERARVIMREYSTVPGRNLSPDQWIKSRQHMLWFLAFLSLVVCVTLIVIVALVSTARVHALENELIAVKAQTTELKALVAAINPSRGDSHTLEALRRMNRTYDNPDPKIDAILADPSLNIPDKIDLASASMLQRLDQDIAEQSKRIETLRNTPAVDVEVMKLKRLVDRRSQMFDLLRQIIDQSNKTAKGIIDSMGR